VVHADGKSPDVVHQDLRTAVEIGIENLARIHQRLGDDAIDVVFLCGTDFGTQTSSFCSVRTFDSLWKPHYVEVCDWIHKHTTWKTFKHSCGSSERFFESMIDAGSTSSTRSSARPKAWTRGC